MPHIATVIGQTKWYTIARGRPLIYESPTVVLELIELVSRAGVGIVEMGVIAIS